MGYYFCIYECPWDVSVHGHSFCKTDVDFLKHSISVSVITPVGYFAALSSFIKLHKWRHQWDTFDALLAICVGNSPLNSPRKDQLRGALMFSLICAWINGWVNNREAGDLRRFRANYDVIVMRLNSLPWTPLSQICIINEAILQWN